MSLALWVQSINKIICQINQPKHKPKTIPQAQSIAPKSVSLEIHGAMRLLDLLLFA